MISEFLEAKRYLGARFGIGEYIPDGVYAIPTMTNRGKAFMRCEIKGNEMCGQNNFWLFWDEDLKINWYDNKKPLFSKESKFSKVYRKLQSCV